MLDQYYGGDTSDSEKSGGSASTCTGAACASGASSVDGEKDAAAESDGNNALPLAVKTMLSPWGVGLSFLILDADLDGHLTAAELQSSGVQIAMKLLLLERELRRVFDLLDHSKTGVVSKTDALKAMRTDGNVLKHIKLVEAVRPLAAPRRFEDAFTKMDTDKDGHVTWTEFHQFAIVA